MKELLKDTEFLTIFEKSERQWEESRNNICDMKYRMFLSKGINTIEYPKGYDASCMMTLTRTHYRLLKNMQAHLEAQQRRTAPNKENITGSKKLKTEAATKIEIMDKQCNFDNIPEGAEVHMVGRYKGVRHSKINLQSTHTTRAIDVVVNHDKPVFLVLSAYDPVVWHLSYTKGTNIVGVMVGGYHKQLVLGVPEGVKVTYGVYEDKGPCRVFRTTKAGGQLTTAARMIQNVTGKPLLTFNDKFENSRYIIGSSDFSEDALIKASTDELKGNPAVSFKKVPEGQEGISYLLQKRHIRPATPQDIDSWVEAASQPYKQYNKNLKVRHHMSSGRTFVILQKTTIPEGMFGAHSRSFIVPEGVPAPNMPESHNTYYFVESGSCMGAGC
jgi:hypothetical protein